MTHPVYVKSLEGENFDRIWKNKTIVHVYVREKSIIVLATDNRTTRCLYTFIYLSDGGR